MLFLSEPIEGVGRRGGKDLENILKTMVQAIDAERVWGYYIHCQPKIPDRTFREKSIRTSHSVKSN